jgi:hypothetical protein
MRNLLYWSGGSVSRYWANDNDLPSSNRFHSQCMVVKTSRIWENTCIVFAAIFSGPCWTQQNYYTPGPKIEISSGKIFIIHVIITGALMFWVNYEKMVTIRRPLLIMWVHYTRVTQAWSSSNGYIYSESSQLHRYATIRDLKQDCKLMNNFSIYFLQCLKLKYLLKCKITFYYWGHAVA